MRNFRIFCLGIGALLASHAWADDCKLTSYGTMSVEMSSGRATTMVKINGNDTRFILDTGGFYNSMSSANAASLSLKPRPLPFGLRIAGVGGSADVQLAHIKDFGILNATLKDVDFIVGGSDAGYGLLGANLLDAADLELNLAQGKVTLYKADHCSKNALAFWSKDGKYEVADIESNNKGNDRRTFLTVTINGREVRALLDSGAPATMLSRAAAERSGIDLNAPGVKTAGMSYGVGAIKVKVWTVPIDSFSVGTETIKHSQMQVLDGHIGGGVDLLLGVDFLLAHHIFIGNSQQKAYFTYNGGRVFSYADAPGAIGKPDSGSTASENDATPKTAPDFALRGQAKLARGEPEAAVTDLDSAIQMAPDQPAYYLARSRAHAAARQPDAALADLDKSLSLDPKNTDALLMRARLYLKQKAFAGALTDVTAAAALIPAGSAQARQVASLYLALNQPTSALPLLDEWIRLHNVDALLGLALNERCWARGLSNQMLNDALDDCRKAIKRDGEIPSYLDSLGLVQLRLGHYPDSIKAYQQSVAQMPKNAWPRYGLGVAEIRGGHTDAGRADLAAARALDPDVEARADKYGLKVAAP